MTPFQPFTHRLRRSDRGFTLIEVLVALLIFSFGVLGVVGMQARAMQLSTQVGDRARAAMLANEAVSQMWAQQSTLLDSTWLTPWNTRVGTPRDGGLPAGAGAVSRVTGADGLVKATVTITWRPPTLPAASPANQYVTSVVMP